ncbi:MAG: integrase [Sulfolobales archaeon]
MRESTLRQYMYYVPRLAGLKLCGKDDVSRVFKRIGLNKSSYEAFSRFLTFLEKTRELDELMLKLRKGMPRKPVAKADTYVPPDNVILEVRENIRKLGKPYTLIYDVLVSSGCRGTEATHLIKHINEVRAVDLGQYVRIHLDLQRGSKNVFVLYLPKEVYGEIREYRGTIPHQDTIEKAFKEAGLQIKYFRKWWRQLLKRIGIDSEDIEAFQGRVSSIGGKHYTDWTPILDENYKKILPHIKKYLIM